MVLFMFFCLFKSSQYYRLKGVRWINSFTKYDDKLKSFILKVHPDLFTQYNSKYSEANSKSLQAIA